MEPLSLSKDREENYKEIAQFFDDTGFDNFELWFYDKKTGLSFGVDCSLYEMQDVIRTVAEKEESLPEWIGANELTENYVVGLSCNKGVFHLPGFYKLEGDQFVDTLTESAREDILNMYSSIGRNVPVA